MKKNALIPLLAALVLLIGIGTTLFVNSTRVDSQQVLVNRQEFTLEQIFSLAESRSLADATGAALDSLVRAAGVTLPETRAFTIIGSDGYQKTVTWENMQNGILTRERESIFADLPKAFFVKEIVEIKVE